MMSKRYRVDGSPRPPYVLVKGLKGAHLVRGTKGKMLPGFANLGGGEYAVAGWKEPEPVIEEGV